MSSEPRWIKRLPWWPPVNSAAPPTEALALARTSLAEVRAADLSAETLDALSADLAHVQVLIDG